MKRARLHYDPKPLIRARQTMRMSRTQVAAKIDRSEAAVRFVEAGTYTGEKTIFLMSEFLGVPMGEILLGGKKGK
jgi:hypothetical protein